jgi:hypothetical protein
VHVGTTNTRYYSFPCILYVIPTVSKLPPHKESAMAMVLSMSCKAFQGGNFPEAKS